MGQRLAIDISEKIIEDMSHYVPLDGADGGEAGNNGPTRWLASVGTLILNRVRLLNAENITWCQSESLPTYIK